MKQRLTIPEANNKYYLLSPTGYAKGIAGSNGGKSVIPNCAGYAACRFNEILGTESMKYFAWWRNAEFFAEDGEKQGLATGKTPKQGAIIVWEGIGSAAGHVAVVEEVKADGSIITSESAWAGTAFYTSHRYKEAGNWGMNAVKYRFIGFVYLPTVEPEKHKCLKKGDEGAEVELMQLRLSEKGYLRKTEIDGVFGKITLGAVCAFQLENKLTVDGICGQKTWSKLS